MKILSMHIHGFGKLHDQDITFEDGLNVVYGKNEAGKSTLHTFIKGMLFGIEKQRGRAAKNDVYSKYEPWQGAGTYQGWLRIESGGQIYRIERRFQKKNKVIIVNETLGKELEPTKSLMDQLRCGLSETAYDNTISIGQLKCATDDGMVSELRNYIANLNTSGSIALDITKATSYLKSQRRELESQIVPEAARTYTSLVSEIRKIEQEISAPQYANQLIEYRGKKSEIKKELDSRQKEKEGLLEKAAKGRQILLNGQFSNQESVQKYTEEARALYKEYEEALCVCNKKSGTILAVFMLFLTVICGLFSIISFAAPKLMSFLASLPFPAVALSGITAAAAAASLTAALLQLNKNRRVKKELTESTRRLQEIFSRHLGASDISPAALDALEGKMAEFLRLSKAVEQSEQTLVRLTGEIEGLQKDEEQSDEEIEQQQHLQWELEQKLEYLSECKTKAEALKRVLAENERTQEELDAIDLAQDTMNSLSTSIRDSFGLYLNKTASELISGITGGIYTSMSIDENLDVYMNTSEKLIPINQVSSGTMDQVYLAVRLAAARLVQNENDIMPLIFDDSFVLYDDDRLKIALKWLVKAYDNQIIIFTCHQREAQLLTANQVTYNFINI